MNGSIVGYDPGGNGSHGMAIGKLVDGVIVDLEILTLGTAEEVLARTLATPDLMAFGIDTLTCWATGPSGWRPADRWLKSKYPQITHSVASANSLFGSMGLNGMAVLIALREELPRLPITETHPKVLYLALTDQKYDYRSKQLEMDRLLAALLVTEVLTANDHEWDAVVSVYAAQMGLQGDWRQDLHRLPTLEGERLIEPCGPTNYWWP